jgi:hypothetical protein
MAVYFYEVVDAPIVKKRVEMKKKSFPALADSIAVEKALCLFSMVFSKQKIEEQFDNRT